jgi:hypothetical protein
MKRLANAMLFSPLIVYLLFPTKEFYWDGVSFALNIEQANGNLSSLLRPNHLIYNLTGYFLFELFGEKVRALFLMQALNSILGCLSILLVYQILKKITGSHYHSVSLALCLAFSATWWKFATDANAYIPSVLFLLICFKLLLPSEKPRPLCVAGIHAIAILFHQLALFFIPAALVCLRRQKQEVSGLLKYAAACFLLTAGGYAGAYHCISYSGSFWAWITTHSADSSFTFSVLHNLVISAGSNFKLFFGGKISQLHWDAVTIAGAIGLALAIGWLFRLRGEIQRGFRELWARLTKQQFFESSPLILWILCYLIFLFFWIPKNTFYRLFYFPAIFFLIGMLGRPWKASAHRIFLPAVLVLFFWNFAFFIYPNSKIKNNEILDFALQHRLDWPQGTTILFSEFHSDLWTIRYFNPQASWDLKEDVSQIIGSAMHAPFWLEGTAYDKLKLQPEGERWLAAHVDMSRSLIHHSAKHTIRFYRVKIGDVPPVPLFSAAIPMPMRLREIG